MQEIRAIYAKEFGTNTESSMNSESGQNETRSTREELQRLARLAEERFTIFEKIKRRCKVLCSDSPRPCPIWQEAHKIHTREMDAQEREGGGSGLLRRELTLDGRCLEK